jgi:CheY-like chemotaxis protein
MRKRLEEELRQAKDVAVAADRAKGEFLANVSHEIRTPMGAILGMTELTLDTPLTDDQRQYLKTVKSAADNLLGILNDLLDFSKIEAGKLELDPADFALRTVVGDTLRALAVRAHSKGLELACHIQPDAPDALVGDAGRLRQILLNLVGNAIKFTHQGEVVVRVEAVSGGVVSGEPPESVPLSTHLRFTVHDTGIGIPKNEQQRIFRAFEQEDTSTTRKYGGTGLGLTIASRLVALMGGAITVDSEPGQGSTFAFTAQFGLGTPQPKPAAGQPPVLRDLLVLVVDDNATNRQILEESLRGWQMKPTVVGDAATALETIRRVAALGQSYALVLLDARMPDMDGLALAAHIRERDELSATPIILLTSGDRPGDLARSRELRIDALLLKPVQSGELLDAIHRVMNRTTEGRMKDEGGKMNDEKNTDEKKTDTAPGSSSSFNLPPSSFRDPLRILVAEDNPFNAQLMEQLLGRRGHRVRVANNGREALARAEAETYDLLLLDVHMPELDGFQVARTIRERERARVAGSPARAGTGARAHLPIIALTARSRKEDREQCLAAGMDDFLTKPVRAAELWSALERVAAVGPTVEGTGAGVLDRRAVLATCGGDAAILEKISQAFRTALPDQLEAVRAALRDGDTPRLHEAAHKICGMVGAFSTLAGGVASALEDRALAGQLEEARPLVARLETLTTELLTAVEGLSLDALRAQAAAEKPNGAAAP